MTLNRWLSPISSDKNPLFNGMFLIPIILTVTLAFEVVAREDKSPIVSTTYAESEQASEDEEVTINSLYQSYLLSLGLTDYTPLPYSGLMIKMGNENDGSQNVYYGADIFGAGNNSGSGNTAMGYQVLNSNTSGSYNTAMGNNSLSSNTTGSVNTATGMFSLFSNTTGSYNTASGYSASTQTPLEQRTPLSVMKPYAPTPQVLTTLLLAR